MSKYKLINKNTSEEHLCNKVTIDGFEYYVSDESPLGDEYVFEVDRVKFICSEDESTILDKKVIATNNLNIDIPKIVDNVRRLSIDYVNTKPFGVSKEFGFLQGLGFIEGYNKSQETHPFSEDDMIEFLNWVQTNYYCVEINIWLKEGNYYTTKELLQLWKEQKVNTLYYE